MSDTDVPRFGWGVIDRSALTSRMPVRLTKPITVDDLPRPLPGFRVELADQEPSLDSIIGSEFRQMIDQVAAKEHETIVTLLAAAATLDEPCGIQVTREMPYLWHGDYQVSCRTRYSLAPDVPVGEVQFKTTGV